MDNILAIIGIVAASSSLPRLLLVTEDVVLLLLVVLVIVVLGILVNNVIAERTLLQSLRCTRSNNKRVIGSQKRT